MRFTGLAVAIFALLFAALGIGFWVAPDVLAARFGIEAVDLAGLSTLRADLGGLFLALSALLFGGLYTRRRLLLIAAALMLAAAVAGRVLGWATTGSPAGLAGTLPVEVAAIVAIALHVRTLQRLPEAANPRRGVLAAAVGVGAVALVTGLLLVSLRTPKVQDVMFARFVEQNLSRNNNALMKDDALRVAVCGSSAPLPSRRAKACLAVIAGGRIWIVDTGPESTEVLLQWGLPLDKVGGVLLTHFHSDHIGDLGEVNLQTWVQGRADALRVYGGPGVEQVVAGFNAAYEQDRAYRTAHHTAALLPPATGLMVAYPVAMPAAGPRTAVLHDDGALKITAIETNHAPVRPAYAYRFDYKGRAVVITGDTTAYGPLTAASRGADVLISEGINREMIRTMEGAAGRAGKPRVQRIMADVQSYHIAPVEAADMANKAGAGLLVLYHELPAADNPLAKALFTRGLDAAVTGAWDLADDGSLYTLPVGSKQVRIGRVPD